MANTKPHHTKGPFKMPGTLAEVAIDNLDRFLANPPGELMFIDCMRPGLMKQRSDGIQGFEAYDRGAGKLYKTHDNTNSSAKPKQTKDGTGSNALDCWRWDATTECNGIYRPQAIKTLDKFTFFWCGYLDPGPANETQCFVSGPTGTPDTTEVLRLQVTSGNQLFMLDHNQGPSVNTVFSETAHNWTDGIVFGIVSNGPAGIRCRHNRFLCTTSPGAPAQFTLETGDLSIGALAGFGNTSGLSHGAKTYFFGAFDNCDINEAGNASALAAFMDAVQERIPFVTTVS